MKRRMILCLTLLLLIAGSAVGESAPGERANAAPADFDGLRAGVITGSFHDSVIAAELPAASIDQYNNYTDLVAALKSRRIDYFLASTEVSRSLMEADDMLTALDEPVRVLDIGAMFAKSGHGDRLRQQMDAFIAKLRADGTLDEIYAF